MVNSKLQNKTTQKLASDYSDLHSKWNASKTQWLIENAQQIYIAQAVYKQLSTFDFETMKYVLNANNAIESIAENHIEKYKEPTRGSVYSALWDLVGDSMNAQIKQKENEPLTLRDIVAQFPHNDFKLTGPRDFIRFTAEEGQEMLQGLPLIIPKEDYGFEMRIPSETVLEHETEGNICIFEGVLHFKVTEPQQEQAQSFEIKMGM